MNDLDAVSSEYFPNAATELENDLILHWYPNRIVQRYGRVDSLLELGIGHGYTASIFNASCQRHVIVEGSGAVIAQFKRNHPSLRATLIQDYFETTRP